MTYPSTRPGADAAPRPTPPGQTSDVELRRLQTKHLFDEIQDTHDPTVEEDLRAQVADLHLDLVRGLALRYRNRGEPDDDLVQAGCVGLMKAVNGFNPERGPDFLSYAVPTIRGEIKKHFRDCCWTIRPTRRIQELQVEVSKAAGQLGQDLGREPTTHELADQVGESDETVIRALNAPGCYSPRSLDAPVTPQYADDEAPYAESFGEPDAGYAHAETHVMLTSAVRDLPRRDREILALRFFEDLTQREIAERIGVTQMQVSRLLTRILDRLRASLSTSALSEAAA